MAKRLHRHRMFRKRHPPMGARPGTLVISPQALPPAIHVIQYDARGVHEEDVHDVTRLRGRTASGGVTWVDVQGLGSEETLRALAEEFSIHALALESVVNVPQRPKVEAHDQHLLVITRMARLREDRSVDTEQLSVLIGADYVVTIQERYGDVLDPVRERIRQGKGAIRTSGADYLAYAIVDAVIDGYYPILETVGDLLDDLDERVVEQADPAAMGQIHYLKRELLGIRRGLWPQRESLSTLTRDELPFVGQDVRRYLRDSYDHCVQVLDVVETYREVTGGLTDVYLSTIANRQNEVMKVLTIMASIFIPLTFLAGVYGMNFQYMPELHARWGYPMLLVAMALVAAGMLVYFRRKGWIGRGDGGKRLRQRNPERER